MMKPRYTDLAPGERIGPYRIEGVAIPHSVGSEVRYRITATCCGQEYILSRRSLEQTRARGSRLCPNCARHAGYKAHAPLMAGQRLSCYEVLVMLTDSTSRDRRRYRVRTLCCGRELERTQTAIERSHRHGVVACERCNQHQITARRARALLPDPDSLAAMGIISAASAWPVVRAVSARGRT